MMQVTINGEIREISDNLTISALIAELGVDPSQVAVEVNGAIAPKSSHTKTKIAANDRIELVRFIGGG